MELGVQYDIRFATDIAVIGTAAFRATDLATQASTNPYARSAGGGVVAIAPSGGAIAGIDMNRWGRTGSATSQGSPVTMGGQELALVPPGLAAGDGATRRVPLSRQESIRQAEQLIGGTIAFDPGTVKRR